MPVIRVYLPLSRRDLDALASTGSCPAEEDAPRTAFAVTTELTQQAPGLDTEDLEYAAFTDAVEAADAVRAESTDRRVVAAADADVAWVQAGEGEPVTAVRLVSPVPVGRIASFHIDEKAGAVAGTSSDDEADELLWYDVTELEDVRALLP